MEGIIAANISGILIICFVLLLRQKFIFRFSGRAWVVLWKIAILRMLVPFTINVPGFKQIGMLNIPYEVQNQIGKMTLYKDTSIPFTNAMLLLFIIWLLGILVCLGKFIAFHRRSLTIYNMALPLNDNHLAVWLRRNQLKRRIVIKESDRIASPLTYGILKPIILLPKLNGTVNNSQLECIMEHELIHIKRFDVLFKWILTLTCVIYWYNPFIWAMNLFANRDIELACDDILLKSKSDKYKKNYINTIIYLQERLAKKDFVCSSFSQQPIEERVKVMVRNIKQKKLAYHVFPIITAMIIIIFSVNSLAVEDDGINHMGGEKKSANSTEILNSNKEILSGGQLGGLNSYDEDVSDIPTVIIRTSQEKYTAYAVGKDGKVIYDESGTTKNAIATLEQIYEKLFKTKEENI